MPRTYNLLLSHTHTVTNTYNTLWSPSNLLMPRSQIKILRKMWAWVLMMMAMTMIDDDDDDEDDAEE